MSDEQHEGEPNPRIDDACDSLATQLEQMRRERDEARARKVPPTVDELTMAMMDAAVARTQRDAHAMQLEQMRRERDEAQAELAEANRALLGSSMAGVALANMLDEARATNARLHRRAQGVEARSPDDADLIRRLRADVRGQAKHAGYVAGFVYRLRLAANFAQHATSMAVRERDEARAKLARIQDAIISQHPVLTECEMLTHVLRIIDEKEGGM